MHIPISLLGERAEKIVDTRALIDSGAGGIFIDQNFARKLNLPMKELKTPLIARNVDGTFNKRGTIRHSVTLPLLINGRTQSTLFYVTGLGHQNILLGLPWLQETNPNIDWKKGEFRWRERWREIIKKCGRRTMTKKTEEPKKTKKRRRERKTKKDEMTISVAYLMEDEADEDGEPPVVWINAKTTTSQLLAAEEQSKHKKQTIEEILPPHYQQYRHLFQDSTADQFPPARPWDHEIKLKEGFEPEVFKTYALSPAEQEELSKFLEENLRLGRIRPSQSPMGSPFFFVAKKSGKLRPCQDYRYLNTWTVPNAYPLPRTDQLMDRLKGSKYFTKLDIKWGYNNVRIKEED